MSDEARAVPVEGDRERLALAYIRVRGAHNPTADELENDEEVRPCAWCRLAADQHIEAAERAGVSLTGSGLREALEASCAAANDEYQQAQSGTEEEAYHRGRLIAYMAAIALITEPAALSGESGEPYDAPMTDAHSAADSLTGSGLDVERLARAMLATEWFGLPVNAHEAAAEIAREYAALSGESGDWGDSYCAHGSIEDHRAYEASLGESGEPKENR